MNRHETTQTASTKMNSPRVKNGFFATWNGIHLADDCQEDFQCKGGEYCIDSKNFLCQQTYRYCISKSLVCDGILNCDTGDESDEKHCELSFIESRIFIMIAVIGPTLFIFISIIFCMLHKMNKNKFENKNDKTENKFPMPTFIVARGTEKNKKLAKILVIKKNERESWISKSPTSDPFDSSENTENQALSKENSSKFFTIRKTESKTEEINEIDTKSARRNSYTKAINSNDE